MATNLKQFTYTIQCKNQTCGKQYPVSLQATSFKRAKPIFCKLQVEQECPTCRSGAEQESASKMLQASGLADMYRPIQNKPFAVDTDYDADGTPKKEWRNYESKTERALRECSASVQGTQVERYWFEGTLEAFMSL